ncbi:MAG: 23S rRNA (pseudouridine(1915)-N(3))-methyltransferase RlmH [Desulfovibrio sp.]|nr:23S rRNA (pseudouridine(1915)-N(3))-methyltransferase RlmH [Desulfovibrio sp.]
MAKRPIHLICVGKIKEAFLQAGCNHYLERLKHWRNLSLQEVRDGDAALTCEARKLQEGERLLKALNPHDLPIVLDERGTSLSSPQLAHLLKTIEDDNLGIPCFLIGGPFGLSEAVRQRAKRLLALSSMTYTHELARLILLEQLYRAECILRKVPYHH